MTDELKQTLQKNLLQLEGVAAGLEPFHPRVGQFMIQRIEEMRRAIYNTDDQTDLSRLSNAPKPGSPELRPHPYWDEEQVEQQPEAKESGFVRFKGPDGRRGRPSIYTPEEREERQRAYRREYYRRKKAEKEANG